MYEASFLPLFKASWETVYMVFIAGFISIACGLGLGCFLFVAAQKKTQHHTMFYRVLGFGVNIIRSLPFIILMIMLIPFTRLVIGTSIGTNAAIVPLAIAAIPFFARVVESALKEIPHGLIEAAQAMGASTWQIVTKVLLPESLPALIRGATLTLIGLIGYSAMAGVVGGGGLGELAINYGYQRFDVVVMLETVLILLSMVQFIQTLGEHLAKKRRIKGVFIASTLLSLVCLTSQLWPSTLYTEHTLRVGVMSGWSEEVMRVAASVAKETYHIELQIVPFTDYVQPNTVLAHHNIDVNIFQHLPYLEAQTKMYHYQLVSLAKTFVYPMGFYSQKINRLSQLKTGAIIAIPNDPSNGGRALLLLQKYGLIKLKKEAGTLATQRDIIANPRQFQFKLLDVAQLPRTLKDADLVAITNDFLTPAGLSIQQALLKEGSDSPYANLIVVRKDDKEKPIFQEFVAIMHSKAVLEKTKQIFPHGAAIPAW